MPPRLHADITEALAAIRSLCPSPRPVSIEAHDAAVKIARTYGFDIYGYDPHCRERMIYSVICISRRHQMQVAKWGNSLAVRLPAAVVEALELKEGDQIEIRVTDVRTFEVQRDRSRQDALDKLRKLRRPLPPGFVFDRNDANAR
jgi:antitoxin MazE